MPNTPFFLYYTVLSGDPYSYCLGKRYAQKPSSFEPACVDHNMSLNTVCTRPVSFFSSPRFVVIVDSLLYDK